MSSELRSLALSVLMPGFNGTRAPVWLLEAAEHGLGAVGLFSQNCIDELQVRALGDELRERQPRILMTADEEGGSVSRIDGGLESPWPAAAALGNLDDVDATHAVGLAIGNRAASAGIDMVAAPVLDVNSEPDNPVIGTRSFGADADLVSRHGVAFARGLDDGGAIACGKHFPGHGATVTDSHVGLPVLDIDEATWRARDLPPFVAAIEAGVPAIMTAHVVVRCLDDVPSTVSAPVLRVLREELGFTGVIVSDALDMQAISEGMGRRAGAVRALQAGVDLLCIGNPAHPADYNDAEMLANLTDAIVEAIQDGTLSEERVVEASERVAALAERAPAADDRPEPRPRATLLADAGPIADRTVSVEGDTHLGDDAVVIVPQRTMGFAAEVTDSPMIAELRQRRPSWRIVDVADAGAAVAAATEAAPAAVAVVLEGMATQVHRPLVQGVLDQVPQAVVVYAGLQRDDDLGTHTIHTHGTGGSSGVAVADLLTGENR